MKIFEKICFVSKTSNAGKNAVARAENKYADGKIDREKLRERQIGKVKLVIKRNIEF